MAYNLDARNPQGEHGWEWLLTRENGEPVTSYEVELDPNTDEYRAFCDFHGYLREHRDAADPVASEAAIVERMGDWIGRAVFGPLKPYLRETTVRVRLDETSFLLDRPLELAHFDGRPLIHHEVALVYDCRVEPAPAPPPSGDEMRRVLAILPMPAPESALGLRRERKALERVVRDLADRLISLEVLQYGVTEDDLRMTVGQWDSWDIVHLRLDAADHLMLQTSSGGSHPLPVERLFEILKPLRQRVRLVVLSTVGLRTGSAHALRTMGLTAQADGIELADAAVGAAATGAVHLAGDLARHLDTGVFTFRYPVADDFLVELASDLYQTVLGAGQPVDVAVARVGRRAAARPPSPRRPPLSRVAPVLFGAALGLRVPAGKGGGMDAGQGMGAFPPEPEHLVGRVAELRVGSALLARDSAAAGVMFLGDAGVGTTACAVELAYRHRERFSYAAWWAAEREPEGWTRAVPGLTGAWAEQLPNLKLMREVRTDEEVNTFLPLLGQTLRQRVLVVVENVEALLNGSGQWQDARFKRLFEVITRPDSRWRVILTGRRVPAGLDTQRIVVQPVAALSTAEGVLLARELPALGRLLHENPPPSGADSTTARAARDRQLTRAVLAMAAGRPKLVVAADELIAAVPAPNDDFLPPLPPMTPFLADMAPVEEWAYPVTQLRHLVHSGLAVGCSLSEPPAATELVSRIDGLAPSQAIRVLLLAVDGREPSTTRLAELATVARLVPQLTADMVPGEATVNRSALARVLLTQLARDGRTCGAVAWALDQPTEPAFGYGTRHGWIDELPVAGLVPAVLLATGSDVVLTAAGDWSVAPPDAPDRDVVVAELLRAVADHLRFGAAG